MLNKIILIGLLGKDPELRYTPQGTAVCGFSLACTSGFGDKKKTEWFKVNAWQKTAEACEKYLTKGDQVYVEGRMESRSWDKDGTKMTSWEVQASDVKFLKTKGSGQSSEHREEPAPEEVSDLEPF